MAPITHTPPADVSAGIELPPATRRRIGLDDVRQWIVLSDLNSFLWPGPDLRPIPGQGLNSVIIGVLPAGLSRLVNERLQGRIRSRLVAITTRSDLE